MVDKAAESESQCRLGEVSGISVNIAFVFFRVVESNQKQRRPPDDAPPFIFPSPENPNTQNHCPYHGSAAPDSIQLFKKLTPSGIHQTNN